MNGSADPGRRHGAGRDHPHIVIVGAGFGGLAAAKALGGAPARVTVIDRENYHLFQPLLYQVATASLSPADVAEPIRRILHRHDNIDVLMGEVTGVDLDRRQVAMNGRTIGYDRLIIATGATYQYFGHPDWSAAAPGLKTVEDARIIRARILTAFERAEMAEDDDERRRLMTFVLVGGGPTGTELAGAIAELARQALRRDFRRIRPETARIVLLEAMDRLLSGFPDELADYAARALGRLGVEVRTGAMVTDISADGVSIGNERLESETVIWTAGVAANALPLCTGTGEIEMAKGDRVAVAPDLSVAGHPEVYVIGDAASCRGPDGQPLPGLAAVASQQGQWLGRRLAGLAAGQRVAGEFVYKNRGQLATLGRRAAVADLPRFRLRGAMAWWLWGLVHVYLLVGFQNRLAVLVNWFYQYVTFQRGARIITAKPRDKG